MPLWRTSDELLFLRTTRVHDRERIEELNYLYEGVSLFSVSLENREVNLVMDLSDTFLAGNSAAAISPLGNLLAITAPEIVDDPFPTTLWGQWVINLDEKSIVQLSSQSEWEVLLPDNFTPTVAYPTGNRSIRWLADNNTVVTALTWRTEENISIPVQFVTDISEQSIVPIVDYSNSEPTNMRFSLATLIQYESQSINYIAFSTEDQQYSLYNTSFPYTTSINLGFVDFPRGFTEGIGVMSENGNVLVDGTRLLLQFAVSQEDE
jgi:hypothetical protein